MMQHPDSKKHKLRPRWAIVKEPTGWVFYRKPNDFTPSYSDYATS